MFELHHPARPIRLAEGHRPWPDAGHQWLPVSGFIPYRFLVTYRVDARALAPLLPDRVTLDTRAGFGFMSVCALEVEDMGLAFTPRWMRFQNREFLYRLAVRLDGRATFITLRSDVSSNVLSYLGRHFSHYRPKLSTFSAHAEGEFQRLECVSADGYADAVLEAETGPGFRQPGSVFSSAREASDFLLGMEFSTDVAVSGRVQVQYIEHSPWNASFAQVRMARFGFLDRLSHKLRAEFVYDHTLGMRGIEQLWKAAQWL